MQHIGIINYKNKIIYVDLKDNNLFCYYYHNNEKRNIGINTIIELLKVSIFDKTKEKFLEQDGQYNVFLNQETGYKHFYKNGKEDILKFFLINGADGLLYEWSDIKSKYLKVNRFINEKANVIIITSLILATAISLPSIVVNKDETVQSELDLLNTASLETEHNKYYDFESLANAIKSPANVGGLRKDILYSEELIKDICNTPMTDDRIKSLEEKTTNIEIVPFTEEEKQENLTKIQQGLSPVVGYYSPLEPNIIHTSDLLCADTIIHEFAHLLQDNNIYHYIRETCAEIISYEYYGYEIDNYKEEVKRIQVLMEIIGSEAIWDINFNGDSSKFDDIILENMSIEEYGELFSILITSASYLNEQEREEVNNSFDIILSHLYSNIYNEPIENNEVIQNIYKDYDETLKTNMKNKRHYFNDVENNESRPDFVYSEYMTFQEAEEKGLIKVEMEVSSHIDITEEEYKKRLANNEDAYFCYEPLESVEKKYNPETNKSIWIDEKTSKEYTTDEALEQGLIRIKYYYIKYTNVNYRNISIDDEMEAGNIVGSSCSIIPMTDKYDSIKMTDSQEIDGKKYYMVECINNIYISNDKTKATGSSKSR